MEFFWKDGWIGSESQLPFYVRGIQSSLAPCYENNTNQWSFHKIKAPHYLLGAAGLKTSPLTSKTSTSVASLSSKTTDSAVSSLA